jgi:hypothetical protein
VERGVCGSGLCVSGEKLQLTERLNWIRDKSLTSKQRFLIEQVAWGRKTFEKLAEFFGGGPKHLRYKVINPLINRGILSVTNDAYEVHVETVHQIFVESGGEDHLKKEMGAIEAERAAHKLWLEERDEEYEPGATHEDSESEVEKRQAAVLRGELDWDEMPSPLEILRALPKSTSRWRSRSS